jgi:hypothetical protein
MEDDLTNTETNGYFGHEPEHILRDYWQALEPSLPVLDIGAGQGRHSSFLARHGITVDALDTSLADVRAIADQARREGLPIRAFHNDFTDFVPPVRSYGGILLFGLIPNLPPQRITDLLAHLDRWTVKGSVLFVTALSTGDPLYAQTRKEWDHLRGNSFSNARGEVRTFLAEKEILTLFCGYGVVYHWEGMGPVHHHGDGTDHRHGLVHAVLRRA